MWTREYCYNLLTFLLYNRPWEQMMWAFEVYLDGQQGTHCRSHLSSCADANPIRLDLRRSVGNMPSRPIWWAELCCYWTDYETPTPFEKLHHLIKTQTSPSLLGFILSWMVFTFSFYLMIPEQCVQSNPPLELGLRKLQAWLLVYFISESVFSPQGIILHSLFNSHSWKNISYSSL